MTRDNAHKAKQAARSRAYRAQRKADGDPIKKVGKSKPRSSGVGNNVNSKFNRSAFVAIDGEGWDIGPERTVTLEDGQVTTSREHRYTMLGAYSREIGHYELYQSGNRLRAAQIMEFLCDVYDADPDGIMVGFALSYDWNHWYLFDLDRADIARLAAGQRVHVPDNGACYDVTCRPRKSLTITRYSGDRIKWEQDKKGKWLVTNKTHTITVWDAWGFFQGSFVKAIEEWLGKDHPMLASIAAMKARRGTFDVRQSDEVAAYNRTELETLVQMMEHVRSSLRELGIPIQRWDGAGAIAAGMNRIKKVRAHMPAQESPAFLAARHAYSGGHIESMMVGVHRGKVYHYDLNSAYPAQYKSLPSMVDGVWSHGHAPSPPMGFTVVRLSWSFLDGLPFYPLFYRLQSGAILYPRHGHGWYWMPEYDIAREFIALHGGSITVHEHWHYEPWQDAEAPFPWVQEFYALRQDYIRQIKSGETRDVDHWKNGAQKTIKLGLNSLYGKTAQQVGGRDGKPPAYFCLEWAGYITSATRAALMSAALSSPRSIICFATDGIYSTEPLQLHCPKEKQLGAWEYTLHSEMTLVVSGVYWTRDDGDEKHHGFSRGYEKDAMETPDIAWDAWRDKRASVRVPSSRLIGMGTAALSDEAWANRGRFVQTTRDLDLSGDSAKRHGLGYHNNRRFHLRMYPTTARSDIWGYDLYGDKHISAPYPIAWIDDGAKSEHDAADTISHFEELDGER